MLNYDYLDAYIKKVYLPQFVDQILGSNPTTLRFFGKAKERRGGSPIMVNLSIGKNASGGSYGKWDSENLVFYDTKTQAEFTWKYNRKFIVLSHIDELENAGDGKVIDLIGSEIETAKQSFKDDLGIQFFGDGTGNNSLDITGLKAAIDDGTVVDTYAGIKRTDYSWWKSRYDYNSGVDRALTVALMQRMMGLCSGGVDSSDKPTLIVTTQNLFDKYASLMDVTRDRGESELARAGFSVLYFAGIPITVDSHCPEKYMYFINENHMWMYVHPDENFTYVPFAYKIDQEVMVAKIRLACQLIQNECRKSGVIRCLDYTL